MKYYVRLGGTSQPAPHRLIEDIRNRAQHPKLEVHDLHIVNVSRGAGNVSQSTSAFQLNLRLRFGLRNLGKVRASNVCLQLSSAIPIAANSTGAEFTFRSATPGTVLLEFSNPFYPDMGAMSGCSVQVSASVSVSPQGGSLTLGGLTLDDVFLFTTVFADSAPAHKQQFALKSIVPQQDIGKLVAGEVEQVRTFARRFNPANRGR